MKLSIKKIITSLFASVLFIISLVGNITVSAACQPKLYLLANNKQTYMASPGEKVTITYNVDAPDQSWSAMGLHINYDKRLIPVSSGNKEIDWKKGDVIAAFMVATSTAKAGTVIQGNKLPDNLNTFFVTAAAAGNQNDGSGTVISFDVNVPSNAKSGDKYPIEFWFIGADVFASTGGDKSVQEYAFANAKNCSIIVK